MAHSKEIISQVEQLVKQGLDSAQIEKLTGIPTRTQRTWRRQYGWDVGTDAIAQLEFKIQELLMLKDPTENQLKQLDLLYEKLAKFREQNEKQAARQAKANGSNIKKKKNSFVGISLDEIEKPPMKLYQTEFLNAYARDRFYLKSRQIGFSYVVAWEALEDVMITGKNKIFISASKNQVGQIRTYIKQFSLKYFKVELKGTDKITIINPKGDLVEFHFLSTNSITTQSYHGDLYIDEFCWIPNLRDILDTALAQASHDRYRVTYISTPSIKSHYSYNIWEGLDEFGNPTEDDISRKKITIHDAIAKGCDFFNLKRLEKRYTPRQFLCEWIDDAGSIFKMADLEECYYKEKIKNDEGKMVRDNAKLPEYKNVGNPIYIGYDPNGGGKNGDSASIAVGEHRPDKLRIIRNKTFNNMSINWQAQTIKTWVKKYKAGFLGIDVTGIGEAVYNLIKDLPQEVDWPLTIKRFLYDRNNKIDLILHMERIVAGKRLEFDHNEKTILQSFLAIKTGATGAGRSTIIADRKKGIGHADLFFAIAHLAYKYPIEDSRLNSAPAAGVSSGANSGNNSSSSTKQSKTSSIGISNGSNRKTA